MCWEPPGSSESPRPTGHFVISQSCHQNGISMEFLKHSLSTTALVQLWSWDLKHGLKSPPSPSCVVLFHSWALFHITVGWEHPKHPGGVKLSWIIKLGNGFEAKGHLQQEVICCGCHHLEKGLFRGAGEVGGCGFSCCGNSTVQIPRTHCFLLWEGIGAWVGGMQKVSAHCGAGGSQAPSWSAG